MENDSEFNSVASVTITCEYRGVLQCVGVGILLGFVMDRDGVGGFFQ